MFFQRFKDDAQLSLSIPLYADELFALTDQDRHFRRQWLPSLDTAMKPSDTTVWTEAQLVPFQCGKVAHVMSCCRDRIAGVPGDTRVDQANAIGHIGS